MTENNEDRYGLCTYIGIAATLGSSTYEPSLQLHIELHEDNGYEDSPSKWYLLSGVVAPRHDHGSTTIR